MNGQDLTKLSVLISALVIYVFNADCSRTLHLQQSEKPAGARIGPASNPRDYIRVLPWKKSDDRVVWVLETAVRVLRQRDSDTRFLLVGVSSIGYDTYYKEVYDVLKKVNIVLVENFEAEAATKGNRLPPDVSTSIHIRKMSSTLLGLSQPSSNMDAMSNKPIRVGFTLDEYLRLASMSKEVGINAEPEKVRLATIQSLASEGKDQNLPRARQQLCSYLLRDVVRQIEDEPTVWRRLHQLQSGRLVKEVRERFQKGKDKEVALISSPVPLRAIEMMLRTEFNFTVESASWHVAMMVELKPYDAFTHELRGLLSLNEGDISSAMEDFSSALKCDPYTREAILWRGVALLRRRDFAQAYDELTGYLKVEPNSARGFHERGMSSYGRGDYKEAIVDFSRAIEIDPTRTRSLFSRALANADTGNLNGALDDLNRVISSEPHDPEPYGTRASILFLKGAFKSSEQDYTRYLQIDPLNATAQYQRGLARRAHGDANGALEDFKRALELSYSKGWCHLLRGHVYLESRSFNEALAEYQKAKLDSSGPHELSLAAIRMIQLRLGKGEAGVDELKKYLATKGGEVRWPGQILGYLIDEVSEERLMLAARAEGEDDPAVKHVQACYYVGIKKLLIDKADEAASNLIKVRDTAFFTLPEHRLAVAELERLERKK